jgi:hypothetical protein
MSLTITQVLIDKGYTLLTTFLETKQINDINRESIEDVMAAAIVVTLELLPQTTRHAYLVDLTMSMLRKLVESQVSDLQERKLLLNFLDAHILTMLPVVSCWPFSCASCRK